MPRSDRSPSPHSHGDPIVEEAARRRDRGQRRVRLATRWAVVGAVAGTAALGVGYASAIPGSSAKPAPAAPPAASSGGAGSPGTGSQAPTAAPGGGASTKPSQPSQSSPQPSKPSHSSKPSKPSGGLRTPAQPPAPTTQPPQTTSGGS
ncbi:hypothetical protein [Actinacidiphila bryophytorum]|uniref:Uncharacterized protein n=1 Tax=Actinacidiphila bryophytorum TaxID=1436133 RepID=A0A9W4H1R1_9ACTN|nr:hypothetical protein [Actinacidiphila bryophytorum]MBM9435206.1 hypothetical protein [Actinacidiphila bryophytorum]MBN6541587.1 hypothetical protein [Actinacidiphila bryophytorum]CAG7643716.1 conserved hypothetical protein [Actinacidiphila bryophytorum]